jgi:hypothetical protein
MKIFVDYPPTAPSENLNISFTPIEVIMNDLSFSCSLMDEPSLNLKRERKTKEVLPDKPQNEIVNDSKLYYFVSEEGAVSIGINGLPKNGCEKIGNFVYNEIHTDNEPVFPTRQKRKIYSSRFTMWRATA